MAIVTILIHADIPLGARAAQFLSRVPSRFNLLPQIDRSLAVDLVHRLLD
ncbi:hypothetical protein WDV85_01540 [Pseudokineococcus sp. 5B2Z-1]